MIEGSASGRAAVVQRITGVCGSPPASSRAIERWCYRAAAFWPAVVIVDDGLWDYVVGESYPVGA